MSKTSRVSDILLEMAIETLGGEGFAAWLLSTYTNRLAYEPPREGAGEFERRRSMREVFRLAIELGERMMKMRCVSSHAPSAYTTEVGVAQLVDAYRRSLQVEYDAALGGRRPFYIDMARSGFVWKPIK